MASRTRCGDGAPHLGVVVALALGHHDEPLLALVPVDAEGDDVAGAHAVDVGERPLDVLGEHVAAADDDHVLDAAAHDHLAVEQVGEVAGAQPAVVEELGVGVGALVVAGGHRRAADLELADLALLEHVAGDRVDDPDLEPEHRPAEDGEATGRPVAVGVDRAPRSARPRAPGRSTGSVRRPGHRLGERAGDGHLGHAEGGEHRAGSQAVALAGLDERGDGGRVDRLGAVEGDPQPGQVERLAAPQGCGRPARRRSSGRRWRCRRRWRSTPSTGSGRP